MSLRQPFKRCSTCRGEKPLADFNRNRANKDGLHHQCRLCHRATVAKSIKNNPETHRRLVRQYAERHPEKIEAKWRLQFEVRMGRIQRPGACEGCGVACKPDAHHDDYSKPFEVRWLCDECHHSIEHGGRIAA